MSTNAQYVLQAIKDCADYTKAMISGDSYKCEKIELKYDLWGYPPEIVSFGLNAAAQGKDVMQEISLNYE